MKKIFTSLSLILSAVISHSQIITDWQFDNAGAYNYYPTTNIISDGVGTYVCSQSMDAQKTAYIFHLDDAGNLIAQDSVHNFDYSILDNKRMIRDNSGSFYLCGNVYDSAMHSKIRLIKYDSLLNRTWDITYIDSNTNIYSSTGLLYSQTENKIYLLGEKYDSASHTIVVKFDTSGNSLWETPDTLSSTYALTAYALDNSGNVILGGYAFVSGFGTAEDFLVSKIDTSGSLAWLVRENGSSNSDDWVFDICVDYENNIYASGIFEDTSRYKIFKYDKDGNRLWTRNMSNIGLNKIATDFAGSLYIVGYDTIPEHEFIIYKYDSAGNNLHTTFSDISNYNVYNLDYFVSIQTNDSGNVYLLHSADSSGHLQWLAAKLDSSLNIKWSFVYPENTANPATPSMLCVLDERFIISGKVDGFLRVIQFHETFPTVINENNNENQICFQPNPVSENLYFQKGKIISDESIFKIYDVNARVLMEGNLTSGNGDNYYIPVSSLKNGIYFLTVQGKKNSYSGKFVVSD